MIKGTHVMSEKPLLYIIIYIYIGYIYIYTIQHDIIFYSFYTCNDVKIK